jgi:hypothetical protein
LITFLRNCSIFTVMRWIYIWIIIVGAVHQGAAQQLSYGVKTGLNLSDIAISNYIDPDAESDFNIKAGFHAGMFVSVPVYDRFALAVELLYSGKGVKAITNINLHYIALPVLIHYFPNEKWIFEVGPEFDYLFSARSKYGNVSEIYNNRIDIGLDAGVVYNLSSKVSFGMRFNAGFLSVIKTQRTGTQSTDPIRYQNRVLQFSLNFKIREKEN